MKNKNPNHQNLKTPKIETRGDRKVKDFRKSKVLEPKESLAIDLQANNVKEKVSQTELDRFLERITDLTLNLNEEVGELKKDMFANASFLTSLRKEICTIRENMIDLTKVTQDSNQAIGDFADGLENFIDGLKDKIQSQAQDIERIKICMEVFSSHISILEKRSEKWTDKFRLGRLKPKNIENEQVLKQHITEINQAKTHFALNDD